MDKKDKISFIPQKPILRKAQGSKRPISLMVTLSFVLFFITLFVYGGMFFYNNNLKKIVANKQIELVSAKQKLDPDNAMENAQRFQIKINNIKKLLSYHIAPSAIFGLLEEITLKSIKFDSFKFSSTKKEKKIVPQSSNTNKTKKEKQNEVLYSVFLKGIAPSYASVAYQSDVIKKEIKDNKRVSSFVISNVSLDKKGNVLFDLKLNIIPVFLAYGSVIKQDQVLNAPSASVDTNTSVSVDTNNKVNKKEVSASDNLNFGELNNILNGN